MSNISRRALLATLIGGGSYAAMTGPTDLSSLFAGDPAGGAQNVSFRQGVVLTFDQNTLANTILISGSTFTDVPLLGVAESSSLVPGAVVGVLVVGDEGQAKTMFIIGRAVIPNTPDATNAISLLNSLLTTDYISSLPSGEATASTTYTDLATVGPTVTMNVGPSGRILILASVQIQSNVPLSNATTTIPDGRYDVAFSGANTRTPNEAVDPLVGILRGLIISSASTLQHNPRVSTAIQATFTGLNPGVTTIQMKYRKETDATQDANFFRRALTVFRL